MSSYRETLTLDQRHGDQTKQSTSKVLAIDSDSDDKYVRYAIKRLKDKNHAPEGFNSWNFKTLKEEKFKNVMDTYVIYNDDDETTMRYEEVGEYLRAVSVACSKSMKEKGLNNPRRKPNTWWNAEIEGLRAKINKKRRIFQRARKKDRENQEELASEYKETRKKLKYKIWDSKVDEWKQMCEDLNKDICGRPYKAIMNKIKRKCSLQKWGEIK